jgi:uncharacterized membrane protein
MTLAMMLRVTLMKAGEMLLTMVALLAVLMHGKLSRLRVVMMSETFWEMLIEEMHLMMVAREIY